MIKVAFSIIMAFVLAGCSSRPVSMNYYLLHEPVQPSETQDITTWPSIELRSLSIPEYLKQRSLIVQLSPSELHFSPQHVWSEPVEQGVVQSLKDNLATSHKFRLQTQRLWTNSAQSGYILDISIDDFILLILNRYLMVMHSMNCCCSWRWYPCTISSCFRMHCFSFIHL